jgi:IstB-like ATP binding protein
MALGRSQSVLPARQFSSPKDAMILASNGGFGEWGGIFGDAVVATALLDSRFVTLPCSRSRPTVNAHVNTPTPARAYRDVACSTHY